MILRDSGLVIATGMVFGVAASFAVGRLLESQLYGVRPIDPLTLLASCAALGAAAMFATWWPVHRAASGNPLEALREE